MNFVMVRYILNYLKGVVVSVASYFYGCGGNLMLPSTYCNTYRPPGLCQPTRLAASLSRSHVKRFLWSKMNWSTQWSARKRYVLQINVILSEYIISRFRIRSTMHLTWFSDQAMWYTPYIFKSRWNIWRWLNVWPSHRTYNECHMWHFFGTGLQITVILMLAVYARCLFLVLIHRRLSPHEKRFGPSPPAVVFRSLLSIHTLGGRGSVGLTQPMTEVLLWLHNGQ